MAIRSRDGRRWDFWPYLVDDEWLTIVPMGGLSSFKAAEVQAKAVVGAVPDPETGLTLEELGMVRRVAVDGPRVAVDVTLGRATPFGRRDQ